MAKIGYARVSSKQQNLDRQLKALEENGCKKIFKDVSSGKNLDRPGLDELIDYVRENDVICITELDRLSRNNEDLTDLMLRIQNKGCSFEILNLPTFNDVTDRNLKRLLTNLILEIYKYQAESERKRIKERQRQGIELAKKRGRYKGRKPLYDRNDPKLVHAFSLSDQGYTYAEIESITGINRRTFQRYKKKYKHKYNYNY